MKLRKTFSCLQLIFFFFSMTAQAEFKLRINEDLGTLDWGYGEVNGVVVQQLMEGLTLSGSDGQAVAGLATSWKEVEKPFPKITFTLRKNAEWSDGRPVCAQDFVDAWTRVLDPKFASPFAHYLSVVKKVTANGCRELVVELKTKASYFPALVSHWVFFPIRNDKKIGSVVTGPYFLAEWKQGQFYRLKRNPRYYGKPAAEEFLRINVVQDDNTALRLFEAGDLDWIKDLPYLERERLSARPEFKFFNTYVGYHLGFQIQGPGAFSRDQRCALAKALDRNQIPMILRGGAVPAQTIVPLELLAHSNFVKQKKKETAQGSVVFPSEEIAAHFYSKDIHVPLMQWVQEQWRVKLGKSFALKQTDGKTYWAMLQKQAPQIFLSGTTATYAHAYSFLSEFVTGAGGNWGHFSSERYDALVKTMQVKPMQDAQRILVDEECAVVPLYFRATASMLRENDWDGFEMNPMGYVYLKNIRAKSASK